jgi:hypothetical protein
MIIEAAGKETSEEQRGTLRDLSRRLGQACMHTLHAEVTAYPDECCAAVERLEFAKVFGTGTLLPATQRWVGGMGCPDTAKNTVQRVACSLLCVMDEGFPWGGDDEWPETLWLDKHILAELQVELRSCIALAAVITAAIEEINEMMTADGIIKSQLLHQVFFIEFCSPAFITPSTTLLLGRILVTFVIFHSPHAQPTCCSNALCIVRRW